MTPGAAVARLGGDEFAVIQHGMSDEDVATFADRLIGSLRVSYETGSGRVDIGASLGFIVASGSDVDFDGMLKAADLASYRIKRVGGGVAQGRIDEREPIARAQLRVVA